jgi:undecaprenyl-diphosphatase
MIRDVELVETARPARRPAALVGSALVLLAAYLALSVDAVHHHLLLSLDGEVRGLVQPLRGDRLDLSMAAISFLGEPGGLIPLILLASVAVWRASRRWALLLPALMAGAGALQLAGKWATDRPRPNAAAWGYPSGHVLTLAVFFGIAAFLVLTLTERRRRFRLLTCAACGAAVGLVAASRIYLDVHWLSDVVGGFTLGTAYLLIAIYVSARVDARRGKAAAGRALDHLTAPPAPET